jgi:hypothetical protein
MYVLLANGRADLATLLLGFDRQGWVTLLAAALLSLITLFTGYSHVDLLGAASFDMPQQAGIPCIAAGLATAVAEAQLASNDRYKRAAIRDRAEAAADEERERAAIRAQRQAECNLVQLRHQLEPNGPNAQRIRDVISLLEEYGGFA